MTINSIFTTSIYHNYVQDEPLTPDDDSDRQNKSKKQQNHYDDSAEIEAVSFKKFPLDVNSLAKVMLLKI